MFTGIVTDVESVAVLLLVVPSPVVLTAAWNSTTGLPLLPTLKTAVIGGRARRFAPSPRRGEGWGEGVAMLRYRTAGAPSSRPSPREVGFTRLRHQTCLKSDKSDFKWGEGVRGYAPLTCLSIGCGAPPT